MLLVACSGSSRRRSVRNAALSPAGAERHGLGLRRQLLAYILQQADLL
jgi:hypothetical protein